MELGGILHVARRWWTTLVLGMVLAGLAGYYIASQTPVRYESRVRMLVGPINAPVDVQRGSGLLATTYAELVASTAVLEPTITKLRLPVDVGELGAQVYPTADIGTRLLIIRVNDANPERAAAIANELAAQLVIVTSPQPPPPQPAPAPPPAPAPVPPPAVPGRGAAPTPPPTPPPEPVPEPPPAPPVEGQLSVIDAAQPGAPVATKAKLVVMISAVVGGLAVLALLLVVENLSETVRSEAELQQLTGTQMLGAMPTRGRPRPDHALMVHSHPDSARAAAYRLLATKIELAAGERSVRSLLVVDARSSSLSAELTANVALVLASRRRRVVIIDANSDTPEITASFDLQQEPGLTELAEWYQQIDAIDGVDGSRISAAPFLHGFNAAVDVMPLGQFHPGSGPEPTPAPGLIHRLLESADLIIVNAPPIDHSAAALMWARMVDATVLVVRPDRIRRAQLTRVVQTLQLVGASLIGTVLEQGRSGRFRRLTQSASRGDKPAVLRWLAGEGEPGHELISGNGTRAAARPPAALPEPGAEPEHDPQSTEAEP